MNTLHNNLQLDNETEILGYNLFKFVYLTLFIVSLGSLVTHLLLYGF
ncbi:hypothetical protein Q4566_13105 [Tamlana sp. 2_MG-2023]|nr:MULTISPECIES: hypothetical protein [unclassified Tamlana]MDO6761143.1 hypothetical protein [Tamlana sp. 2_MG-2023]MDO6791524.1 hypothetical protein [Tamlana sp. 1_MG-2023]